jgi:hypothetical protein
VPENPDSALDPELLRSLGHLLRGLSVLFWGLPLALVVCVQTSQADYLRLFGIFPPLFTTAILVYGLTLLGRFRRQELVWVSALERARMIALINFGLSPFLFWWSRLPSNRFFTVVTQLMAITGLWFLLSLGPVLRRLTAMLPDEGLRHETLFFTRMNATLIAVNLVLVGGHFALHHVRSSWRLPTSWSFVLERIGQWGGWFLILLAVALTMALLWKTKEVIFHSVFGGSR